MKKLLIILAVLLLGTINVFSQEQTKTLYDVYLEMGYDAYGNGNYESAINWLTKAAEYAKDKVGTQHPTYATVLCDLALCYYYNGNYSKSIELNGIALEIRKSTLGELHPHYAISLSNLALCYDAIGNYSTAIELNKQALEINEKSLGETDPACATSLSNLASCYRAIGSYDTAINLNKEVLKIRKHCLGETHPDYATSLNNLATCYDNIGDTKSAIPLIKQAVKIERITLGETHPKYALTLSNLAMLYRKNGDYSSAIDISKNVLNIVKAKLEESHPDYAYSLNALAVCYTAIGDYSYAIELHTKASDVFKSIYGEIHVDYARTLNYIGLCYYMLQDYNRAIDLYKLCLKVFEETLGKNHFEYTTTLDNLALCYLNKGDYKIASEYNNQSLNTIKNSLGENHPLYAISLNNLILCNYAIGNYLDATKLGKQLQKLIDTKNTNYAIFLSNIVFAYYKSEQYDKIRPIWDEIYSSLIFNSISQFQEMTSAQRQMYWFSNVLPNMVMPNNLYARVLSNNKQSMGLSYNSLLFSKGVILASDIEFDKVIRESGDTVLLEKFEELRTTRAILNTYYNKPIAERPEGEVERLEARAEVLEKDLLVGSKEYADFTRRLEIEWQDVQAALGDKDVAIEILAADEHIDENTPPYYAALVLRKGWDAPKFVELCGAEELQTYFDSDNGLAMMYREANSRKLYDLIWGKLAEYIDEGDNVYFSPGGLLHQVNVELLQDIDGRLANEKYNLHRVSSTRELCFEKPKIAHSEAVLYGGLMYDMDSTAMVAQSRAVRPEEEFYAMRGLQLDSLRGKLNYLSASKTEVEKISEQMNQHGIKTTLYVEQVGNEESFKALSGKKTPIIHLATHGFFFRNEEAKVTPFFRMMSMDQERPRPDNSLRRSGLAFAGAQKAWDGEEIPKGIDDGVMLAQEIASMDLAGTDLVVLSACETGLGEINSEGVFGLQRAFKKAGVQTLVMSLWKVHDEATALFMQTFYGNLLSGNSKRDSFAAAQMALREHKQYGADPYYWAGFIMLD